MILARWKIDARFGHKREVLDSVKWWADEIGTKIGWERDNMEIMTGSIGANESCVVTEVRLDSISALDESWNKLRELEEHAKWSQDLEPNIVSGTHRWEIYRLM